MNTFHSPTRSEQIAQTTAATLVNRKKKLTTEEPWQWHVCSYGEDFKVTASEVANGLNCIGGNPISWTDPNGSECEAPEPVAWKVRGEVFEDRDNAKDLASLMDAEVVPLWEVEEEED